MKINLKETLRLIMVGISLGLTNESWHVTDQIAKLNEYGGNDEQDNNKDDKQYFR